MTTLRFVPPGPDAPGFLRRARRALELAEGLKGSPTPALLDSIIAFVLPFVTEPTDRDAAREALLDASQEDFQRLLGAVGGGGEDTRPTSAPPSATT